MSSQLLSSKYGKFSLGISCVGSATCAGAMSACLGATSACLGGRVRLLGIELGLPEIRNRPSLDVHVSHKLINVHNFYSQHA